MKSTGTSRSMLETVGNRSGIQTAPEMAREQIEGAAEAEPSSEGGPEIADAERATYIAEGYPIGSMPSLPAASEGKADEEATAMAVFLDKLSERLAFERMGTRLYDALINKCEALGDQTNLGPTLTELQEIREEEHRHFLLLNEAVTELGGDPTVESPCADVAGVASMGIMQVVVDPRTSVTQCLQVMLTAELTDNAGWEMLIKLADDLGNTELSEQFSEALENEQRHLLIVQEALTDRVMAQV